MKKIIATVIFISVSVCVLAQESQVQDAMQKKYGDPNAKKGTDWINNQMLNAKYAAAYTFPMSMAMHITTYKGGQKDKESDMKCFINSKDQTFAMNSGDMNRKKNNDEMLIVYDNANHAMLMLNQTEKTGMAMNMNAFMSKDAIAKRQSGAATDKKSSTQCNKTGKTKMIHGYSCEEYVCIDNDRNTKTEAWITNKISVDLSQSGGKGPMAAFFRSSGNLGGMMMQAFMYENNELKTSMEVTELNEKADMTVKTADYKMNQH